MTFFGYQLIISLFSKPFDIIDEVDEDIEEYEIPNILNNVQIEAMNVESKFAPSKSDDEVIF